MMTSKISRKCQDLNLGLLGVKRKCFLCAMRPPSLSFVFFFYVLFYFLFHVFIILIYFPFFSFFLFSCFFFVPFFFLFFFQSFSFIHHFPEYQKYISLFFVFLHLFYLFLHQWVFEVMIICSIV